MPSLPFLAIAVVAGALYPLIYAGYSRMLKYKRDEIISLMSKGKTFQRYLEAFRAGGKAAANEEEKSKHLTSTVENLFNAYYDWTTYLIPVAICGALSFAASSVALAKADASLAWVPNELAAVARRLPPVALSALAGAYVWGLYDMVRNFIDLNLTPARIHLIWLRLLIAPILGYLVALPLNDSGRLVAGFAVGVFPLRQLLDLVQARGTKLLSIETDKTQVEGPTLHHIQGLTKEVIGTLNDEGIYSSQHLALADPIKLLLRTRLEWKMILDIIDQAYLFTYVGEKAAILRPFGIRGAIELAGIEGDLSSRNDKKKAAAENLTDLIASKLGQDVKLFGTLSKSSMTTSRWSSYGTCGVKPCRPMATGGPLSLCSFMGPGTAEIFLPPPLLLILLFDVRQLLPEIRVDPLLSRRRRVRLTLQSIWQGRSNFSVSVIRIPSNCSRF